MKFPVFSLLNREFGFRDEFAPDSLLQRRVIDFPLAKLDPVFRVTRFDRWKTPAFQFVPLGPVFN